MQVSIKIDSTKGFRYLWMKKVVGFVPYEHCAKCLRGVYENHFGLDMPTQETIKVDYVEGDILYFCGVAKPYSYASNLHLVGRVKTGSKASYQLHNGGNLEVNGLEQIHFDDKAARTLFPDRSEAFLSCRNFQFGAHAWGVIS